VSGLRRRVGGILVDIGHVERNNKGGGTSRTLSRKDLSSDRGSHLDVDTFRIRTSDVVEKNVESNISSFRQAHSRNIGAHPDTGFIQTKFNSSSGIRFKNFVVRAVQTIAVLRSGKVVVGRRVLYLEDRRG
jgi:hypothetical protein